MSGTQQQAPPVAGMRRIPFPLESYEHPSLPLTAKRLINLMAEKLPDDARTPVALLSTPGLVPYQVVGSGPTLAMNDDMPVRIYVVSGTRAYRMVFGVGAPVVDDLGDLGTTGSFVTIAVGVTGVVICVPPRAYTAKHDPGTPLNEIGGDVFPGASSVCYVDGCS